jgi:hypothetical protein
VHKHCRLFNGEVQMCTMKHNLDTLLSLLRIWNTRLMLNEVFPYVLQPVLYEIVTIQLQYRRVPRMHADEHKQNKLKKQLSIG